MEADGLCRGSLPSVYKSRSEWALFHIDLRSLMSKEANNKGSFSKKLDMCCLWFYVSNLSLLCCWSTPLIDLDNDARPASAACVGPNYYMKKKAKKKKKKQEEERRKDGVLCSSLVLLLLLFFSLPPFPPFLRSSSFGIEIWHGVGDPDAANHLRLWLRSRKQKNSARCLAKPRTAPAQPAHCAGSAAVAVAVAAEL